MEVARRVVAYILLGVIPVFCQEPVAVVEFNRAVDGDYWIDQVLFWQNRVDGRLIGYRNFAAVEQLELRPYDVRWVDPNGDFYCVRFRSVVFSTTCFDPENANRQVQPRRPGLIPFKFGRK